MSETGFDVGQNEIEANDFSETYVQIATKTLTNSSDRNSIYNCINHVVDKNSDLNPSKRLGINRLLVMGFNLYP